MEDRMLTRTSHAELIGPIQIGPRVGTVYSLHRGRSHRALVRVVPCGSLYRIEWPDIGLSQPANLTRCKNAAREWAERRAVIEDRKSNAARRLKSLNNFWWSSSYVAAIPAEALR
jgi:hypothetical protein